MPQTLHEWLTASLPLGTVDWPWVERRLLAVAEFMTGRGMVHFDVHPGNVLTDGHELYVTDFGLALSTRFALTPVEAEFLQQHRDFDRQDAMKYLVNWLTSAYGAELPPQAAAIVERHAVTTATHERLLRRAGPCDIGRNDGHQADSIAGPRGKP